MRTPIALVLGGSILAMTSAAPLPAYAQNASIPLTCRPALEGLDFAEVRESPDLECCYVVWEQPWYDDNDVRLHRVYLRENEETYLTRECAEGIVNALAGGLLNATEATAANAGTPAGSDGAGGGSGPGAGSGDNDDDDSDDDADDDDDDDDDDVDNGNGGNGNNGAGNNGGGGKGNPADGNPGNAKDVGGAGEEPPNGNGIGFNAPDAGPGTKGKSDG
jgi:hypothetical protein